MSVFSQTPENDSTSRDIASLWKKVDSLENKGLTRSALDQVERIYLIASQKDSSLDQVKALIFKVKYQSIIDENSEALAVDQFKQAIQEADAPVRQLLHTYLAIYYWQHYQSQQWEIMDRTSVSVMPEDFLTWDARQYHREISYHFHAGLAPGEELQKISASEVEYLLTGGDTTTQVYRPTLYDILGHEALKYFTADESMLTQPSDKFELSPEQVLVDAEKFVTLEFETSDSLSSLLSATKIYQDLVSFHLNRQESTPFVLVDLDLQRLEFLKNNAKTGNIEASYEACIQGLIKAYEDHPVVGEAYYKLAELHLRRSQDYDPLISDDHRWEKKTAREICVKVIDQFPNSRGAQLCMELRKGIEEKSLELQVEEVNIPDEPFLAKLNFRNVDTAYFRLVSAPEWQNANYNYDKQKLIELLRRQEVQHEWSLILPDTEDFQEHATEVMVDKTASGSYVLMVSDNPEFEYQDHFVAYAWTQVSQLSYYHRINHINGKLEVYVMDRESGKPIEGVNVQAYEWDYNQNHYNTFGKKQVSNENGYLSLSTPSDYHTLELEFKKDREVYRSKGLYAYAYRRESSPKKSQIRTHFFIDRKIYRPGQTLYFKAIVLEHDGKMHEIKKQYPLTVSFWDVNSQKVEEVELTTNEYGSVSGSFTTPATGLLGNMSLKAQGGSMSFSVEEYKRPNFEIRFDSLQNQYQLNDTAMVRGVAMTYAGVALEGAQATYRVYRKATFPYWGGIYRWRPIPDRPDMEISQGVTTTNRNGEFVINFPLIPDYSLPKEGNPLFVYQVQVDVTDLTGETHSQSTSIRAGYVPILVDIEMSDRIEVDNPGMLGFQSEVLTDIQDPLKGNLTIYRLESPDQTYRNRRWRRPDIHIIEKKEFQEAFPNIPYEQEDDYRSWERKEIVADFEFDTRESRDIPLDKLAEANPGKYVVEFIAMDGEVKIQKYFTLSDESSSKTAIPVVLDSWMDKSSATPGDNLTLHLNTSEKKVWVLYELEQDGKVLDKQMIKLKRNKDYEIPISIVESYRGNVNASLSLVHENSFVQHPHTITVPWSNKELLLTWKTFRSELQPGEEDTWKLSIKGDKGEKIAAEMVATLYDASLDAFRSNDFSLFPYPNYYRQLNWNGADGFGIQYAQQMSQNWNPNVSYIAPRRYQSLNGFELFYGGFSSRERFLTQRAYSMEMSVNAVAAPPPMEDGRGKESDSGYVDMESADAQQEESLPNSLKLKGEQESGIDFESIDIRSNFNETAFFYPHLMTNDSGEVVIEFTIPESLTKWKFLGLAHTQDLKTGNLSGELVTKKKLMVKPNLPRFIREGDQVVMSASISNMTEEILTGSSELKLLDAYTMAPLDDKFQFYQANKTFSAKAGETLVLSWEVKVPEGIQAVVTQIVAQAGDFSDGEEHVLPVLKNRMLVTETLPLAIRGETEKSYQFEKLIASDSSETLTQHQLTLEFTSNPVWYAVQALPYLMDFPYECTEQIYSRYYANSLASHIANSDPSIQRVFDRWKQIDESGVQQSLASNLEKNEELKGILLRETPWLLNAKSESERKKRLGILFDLNRMNNELQRTYRQLEERQYNNGGFSWFPGMPPSRYITQLIAIGMGHLQKLGPNNLMGDAEIGGMINRAVGFLDLAVKEDYQLLKQYGADLEKDHLSQTQIQYLYMRSFYSDQAMTEGTQEAYDYYYAQAKKYWLEKSRYMQGMIALAIHRNGEEDTAKDIIRSLEENAVYNEELGMYWKDLTRGYYWYQHDIEMQALLIEAFEEIAAENEPVEEMKIWLLKNKQTNDWETTRATVAACNALINSGIDLISETQQIEIKLGDVEIDPQTDSEINKEAGTGYFKKKWTSEEIDSKMGQISLKKPTPGIAWGAVYWQYFEQLDQITFAETPVSIQKGLYTEKNTPSGPQLEPVEDSAVFTQGDKVVVRVEIRVDRDMEYVHMKDMRAAGFEPVNVFSQYKIRGGLGYYESTRDEATHFFFEYLPKGTHVFEYPLRATHKGDYSNGITTLQCMYAPEFTSHSEGIRVTIDSRE